MPVLLALLKILGLVLLFLVLVLLVALFVPLRLNFEYRPDRVCLSASYGPIRRTLFSRKFRKKKRAERPLEGKAPAEGAAKTESPQSAQPTDRAQQQEDAPQAQSAPVPEKKPPVPGIPEAPPGHAEEAEENRPGRLEHILDVAQHQPMAFLRCLAGHFNWMRRHAVCKLRVRHLDVFWTVTCEDASDTAMLFGAEMAAFNTLLAVLQQSISVQSDRLWLEPDFTGMRKEERRIAFSLSACTILMVGLAYRLWNDPLLQPQPDGTHA